MPDYQDTGSVTTWTDPHQCPFCQAELAKGGVAFIDHLSVNTAYQTRFDKWRNRIADDISGEWTG